MNSQQTNKKRMAGSDGFTSTIKTTENKYKTTDKRRTEQQSKYDLMEKRGYDDLSNLETYQAKNQNYRLKEGGVFDKNTAAQQGMKNANFDYGGDLSGYNSGAQRNDKFDKSDYRYLQSKGASDEAIQSHMGTLDKSQIHESITTNKKFGGDLYRGDMDKSKGIESYNMGKGFNRSDISYLQNQGYSNEEIANYGLSSGKNFGYNTAKFLANQGRLNTRADNTFDQSANSLPSKMQQKVDAAPIDVKHQYEPPNLETERKRVDEEIDRDYWEEQVNKEAKFNANDTDDKWAENFLAKQLRMHSEAKKTRSTLDLSEFEPDDYLNLNELSKQIDQSIMYDHDQSALQKLKIYGDQAANASRNPFSWKSPKPPKAFETPDFKSIYKQYKKDIDKI